jgi:phosphoesterase RecJ-like protein
VLDSSDVRKAGQLIRQAGRILAVTHIAPDGDAIGSLTGVGVALKQLSKNFALVCDDGLPKRFEYLPLSQDVHRKANSASSYDLVIAVDCGDLERMGNAYTMLQEPVPPIINIDHHPTNTMFGSINFVVSNANSATEILFDLLPQIGVEMTPELATCLLSGLLTDTLGFRTANVTSHTLRVASDLVETGIDLFSIMTQAMDLKELSTLKIWEKGLSNMKFEDDVIWTAISNVERLQTGHNGTSSFGLGSMMANVYEAKMSAVIMEMEDGRASVGFRSRPPYSVSELAAELGGGGHHQASGCTLDGPFDQAVELVVSKSKAAMREQRSQIQKQ